MMPLSPLEITNRLTLISNNRSQRSHSYFNAWSWQHTELQNKRNRTLLKPDIKQLLFTRGEKEATLRNKYSRKSDLIELLQRKYLPYLGEHKMEQLTFEEVNVELKLHGLNTRLSRDIVMNKRLANGLMGKIPKMVSSTERLPLYFTKPVTINKNEYCMATEDDGLHKILKIYCQTKRIDETSIKLPDNRSQITSIILNGELHLFFSGFYIQKIGHWIFLENTKEFKQIYQFECKFEKYNVMYQQTGNKLIFIGQRLREMYVYFYCKTKLNHTVLKCSHHMVRCYYDAVMTRNCQYIILYPQRNNIDTNFFVIDIDNEKIMQSYIVVPRLKMGRMSWKGMIVSNETIYDLDEEYTVYGYLRECWRECKIGMNRFPPQYLIKLIQVRYVNEDNEYFHLFEEFGSHWKMKVGYIVNNLKEHYIYE